MLADSARLVTAGIDTHKDVHVAAVVNDLGAEIATGSFPTTADGHQALVAWLCSHGDLDRVGVEGCGSWGAGIARYLTGLGVPVVEISRPNRQTRHNQGKSDPLDAISAARTALAGLDAGIPKTGQGRVESIRVLRNTRRSAVRDRTATMNQIRSLLDTAPVEVREKYRDLTKMQLIRTITATRPNHRRASEPVVAAVVALKTLGLRWQFLTGQIDQTDELLTTIVVATAPNLVAQTGVGIDTAAALLVAAGDNPDRLGSEAAFAALCGVNPLPASSGRTIRHRLNRAGNRDANAALWRIVLTRMNCDPRTRVYVERRTAEGLSKREIIRCLKRYVARELYPLIVVDLTAA